MASTQHKYMFDVDFGSAGKPLETEQKITAAAHEAALADAEARGYGKGVASAEARERTEAERRNAAAFERIGTAIEGFATSIGVLERQLEAEAIEVAFAVARKLAPELIAREPEAEVAALASACLSELRSAPHIAIRINEKMHANARGVLEGIARARGFEGRMVVLGERDIEIGDCRIEWADGGIVRDRAAAEAAIADTVTRYIAARRGPPRPQMFGD